MKRSEFIGGEFKYFRIKEYEQSDKWLFGKTTNPVIPQGAVVVSFLDYLTGCYGEGAVTKEVRKYAGKVMHGTFGMTGALIIDDIIIAPLLYLRITFSLF